MAVNVSRLWRQGTFQHLSREAKLLYIYLISSPNINSLGLLNTSPDTISHDLGFSDEELKVACKEIIPSLVHVFKIRGEIYFFVHAHFATLPRSLAVSKKADREKTALPREVVEYMEKNDLMPDVEQHTEFKPPTVEEIEEYAQSKGYLVEGKKVVDFYEGKAKLFRKQTGWYDSRGKEVRDWKGKVRQVWFKDENKLQSCKGSPEGFEYFFVKSGDRFVTPVRWSNGVPFSATGVADDMLLQKEFKKRKAK